MFFPNLLGILLEYIYNFLRRWIRKWRLTQYAKTQGYSFCDEDRKNRIQFSAIPFAQSPSESYKLSHAGNIIQGAIDGLKFTYFEKTQIKLSEDHEEKPSGTRSIVAIDRSANDRFKSGETFDKDLVFYRENGTICFYWNGTDDKTIPVSRLDQWLSDIAGTFKAEAATPVSIA